MEGDRATSKANDPQVSFSTLPSESRSKALGDVSQLSTRASELQVLADALSTRASRVTRTGSPAETDQNSTSGIPPLASPPAKSSSILLVTAEPCGCLL